MAIKTGEQIINEINQRGPIQVPKGYVIGEEFEKWLYEENDIFSLENEVNNLYEVITKTLITNRKLITTMESCTSGLIASLITNTEGASSILKGAFVTYSNEVKIMQGVPSKIIKKYGVYSKETSIEMAIACKKKLSANIGIGVTGTMGNIDPMNNDSSLGKVYFTIVKDIETFSYELSIPPKQSRYEYKLIVAKAIALKLLELLKEY